MQQFCDIFGKKGDASLMILGDNPAGHGILSRDLGLKIGNNFIFLMVFNLLKIIHSFESKKHLKT